MRSSSGILGSWESLTHFSLAVLVLLFIDFASMCGFGFEKAEEGWGGGVEAGGAGSALLMQYIMEWAPPRRAGVASKGQLGN
jgi:hypothetical protein